MFCNFKPVTYSDPHSLWNAPVHVQLYVPGDPNVQLHVPGDPNVQLHVPGDPNVQVHVPGDPQRVQLGNATTTRGPPSALTS